MVKTPDMDFVGSLSWMDGRTYKVVAVASHTPASTHEQLIKAVLQRHKLQLVYSALATALAKQLEPQQLSNALSRLRGKKDIAYAGKRLTPDTVIVWIGDDTTADDTGPTLSIQPVKKPRCIKTPEEKAAQKKRIDDIKIWIWDYVSKHPRCTYPDIQAAYNAEGHKGTVNTILGKMQREGYVHVDPHPSRDANKATYIAIGDSAHPVAAAA